MLKKFGSNYYKCLKATKISQRDHCCWNELRGYQFYANSLKRNGLIKWENFSNNPNKLEYMYLLTPQGVLEKAKLTFYLLEKKQAEYELLKIRNG